MIERVAREGCIDDESAERYGEVVRISPDELSFLQSQAWRDIYGHGSKEGRGSAPPKNWKRYGTEVNGTPSLAAVPDPTQHARSRKVFTPAFSDRALTMQSSLFTKYADQLVASLKDGGTNDGVFDMVRMYNFTTFDVMVRYEAFKFEYNSADMFYRAI
jgi:cytochrome P450